MPTKIARNADGEEIVVFWTNYQGGARDDAVLRVLKRDAQRHLEEMQGYQKNRADARDFDGARQLRGLVQDAKRQYRASCYVGGWFMATPLPGDCPPSPPRTWPVEIAAELDRVIGRLSIEPGHPAAE